jgi:hypothetical protein
MEPESSLPFSQELSTGPYPGPDQASPLQPHPVYFRSILISTHLHLGLRSGLFPFGFPTKILYAYASYRVYTSTTRTKKPCFSITYIHEELVAILRGMITSTYKLTTVCIVVSWHLQRILPCHIFNGDTALVLGSMYPDWAKIGSANPLVVLCSEY